MVASEKFQSTYNSKQLKKKKQVILQALQLQFNCETYPAV